VPAQHPTKTKQVSKKQECVSAQNIKYEEIKRLILW